MQKIVGILTTTAEQSFRIGQMRWVHVTVVEEKSLYSTKGWKRFTKKRTERPVSYRDAKPGLKVTETWRRA